MRRYLRHISALLLIITTLIGCTKEETYLYTFSTPTLNVSVPFSENTTTIEYNILYGGFYVDLTTIPVTITAQCDWIKSIDTSVPGEIIVSAEENLSTSERSTYIELTAPSTKKERIKLTQLGTPPANVEHTIIHYFFGTSLSYYFKNNIKAAAMAIGEGVLGDSGRYIFFRQNSQYEGYIAELHYCASDNCAVERHIADVTIEAEKPLEQTIAETLRTLADYAPAHRYGVIFAGHGQGWITRQMLSDEAIEFTAMPYSNMWTPAAGAEPTRAFGENNMQADIKELATGINNSEVELDYILFDACFMSNIEAIYDLRNAANYIVASPCEIMANGFPYHRILTHLHGGDGKQSDLNSTAKAYYDYYNSEYTSPNRSGSVAVINCSELEALADATHSIVENATEEYDKSALQTYEGHNPHTFYDFGEWATAVATDATALAAFEAQLERTIVARYTLPTFYSALGSYGNYPIHIDTYTGITTSAPCDHYNRNWKMTSWYKRAIE